MKRKRMAAGFALAMISVLAAWGWATHTGAIPNDPVEVARAYEKARLDEGDWRIYLSKRGQNVITPEIMAGMSLHSKTRREQANASPKTSDTGSAQLKDVTLVNKTGSTAIVEYHLSRGTDKATLRDYLVNEDGRWAIDTLGPGMRPEWAMPADLRPVCEAIMQIESQEHEALIDDQGAPKYDPVAVQAFAEKNFADISLAQIGAKQFAEKAAPRRPQVTTKRRWMKPVIADIQWSQTVGQTQYAQATTAQVVYWTNEKGQTEAVVAGSASLRYIKEHGQWKWLPIVDDQDLVSRFLQLWIDKDKATIARLIAPDAKFEVGTGKTKTWAEIAKSLPVLSKADPAAHARGYVFLSRLEFTDTACKSGVYEVVLSSTPVGPLMACTKISSVRYLAPDMQTAQKLITDSQPSQAPSPDAARNGR